MSHFAEWHGVFFCPPIRMECAKPEMRPGGLEPPTYGLQSRFGAIVKSWYFICYSTGDILLTFRHFIIFSLGNKLYFKQLAVEFTDF